ncbi:hypothetical protein AURDEDRAFT_160736 [Auricularia subglabra TFB-10046 SS5]|nr:hypothetical protein AURDEDRAFT_160736 [Auricularia subglabra TFB-10046 SS5]
MPDAPQPSALVLHPSQSAKRRRQDSERSVSPPSPRPKKKQKQKETAKERRGRRSKTKLTRDDIPDDYKGTKRAFELHVCLLAGIRSSREVMPQPTIQNIGRFASLFRDHDAVFAACVGPSRLEKSAMMSISSLRLKNNHSQIAHDIAQIEDHNLHQILLQLSRYGISAWCPNYEESPYSVYNSAMRAIALDTFKQAVAAHAYMFLDLSLPVDDTAMLTRHLRTGRRK